MRQITEAIRKRDFETFAKITMMDSNQFHATCLDTYPPIFYMNDISRAIVQVLTRFNALAGIKVSWSCGGQGDSTPPPVLTAHRTPSPLTAGGLHL